MVSKFKYLTLNKVSLKKITKADLSSVKLIMPNLASKTLSQIMPTSMIKYLNLKKIKKRNDKLDSPISNKYLN